MCMYIHTRRYIPHTWTHISECKEPTEYTGRCNHTGRHSSKESTHFLAVDIPPLCKINHILLVAHYTDRKHSNYQHRKPSRQEDINCHQVFKPLCAGGTVIYPKISSIPLLPDLKSIRSSKGKTESTSAPCFMTVYFRPP